MRPEDLPDAEADTNPYIKSSNLEAHVIADMLRIESITTEVREFKDETRKRFDKLENWLMAIVGTSVTTLLTVIIAMIVKEL